MLHVMTIFDFDLEMLEQKKQSIDVCVSNLSALRDAIPCLACRWDYNQHLEKLNTADVYQPMALFKWSVDLHNDINKIMHKPILSYEQAIEIWCER